MKAKINDQQKQAITAPPTPHLIIAGPGTGKTFVLTWRVIHLINKEKIDPNKILVTTFTNKATNELKERIHNYLKIIPKNVGTIHSLCLKLLREKIDRLNRAKDFKVFEQSDQQKIVNELIKNTNNNQLKEKIIKPKRITRIIKTLKWNAITPETMTYEHFYALAEDLASNEKVDFNQLFCSFKDEIYPKYQNYVVTNNLLDYDDMLIFADQLTNFPDIQQSWGQKFGAILVDEFQDTSERQWKIIKKLIVGHQNVFCVGDPDQSIYGWRGAFPGIFLDFQKHFPNTKILKLEQNYRSTPNILKVANHLIAYNYQNQNEKISKFQKKIFTNNQQGKKVTSAYFYNFYENDEQESKWVINKINQLPKTDPNFNFSDVAIFYRNNNLSRGIEQQLTKNKIPYQKLGNNKKFYQAEEIRVIIGYLNLVLSDDPWFIEKVCNLPRRKITETSFAKIKNFAKLKEISLIAAFQRAKEISGLSGHCIAGCKSFLSVIQKLKTLDTTNLAQLVDQVLQISGYQDSLDKETDYEKFENIKALRDWFNNKQLSEENLTLNNLLDEITLYQEEENSQSTKSANQISLMTIHQAKGLEFKYVFMIKLTQGILPDYRCDKLEEERRLFYVGITRAKKELFLSCSTWEKKMEQSVFLAEIEDLPDLDIKVNQIKDFADLEDFTGPDENDHEINKFDQMFKKKINLKS